LLHGDKAPCIQIRALVYGLDPKLRASSWIVTLDGDIFQAVLDESGYGASGPNDVFVFAGYMGKVVDWENFTHGWNDVIARHPELENAEFVKGLARWDGPYSDPRMLELMKVVTDNRGLGSVKWQLSYPAYRLGTSGTGVDERVYLFAWRGVLAGLLATIQGIPNAKLQLFYDENIHEEPEVQKSYEVLYEWLKKERPEILTILPRRPMPKNDNDFWPVRVADVLAWDTHRKRFSNPLSRMLDSGAEAFDITWTADDVRDVLIPGRIRLP
jgi:hypothetical protein